MKVHGKFQGGHALSLRSVRRLVASAGIAAAAVVAFAGSAAPVQAVDFGTNGFIGGIVNFNGQCLDMPSTVRGTQAHVDPCTGSLQQRWAWLLAGRGFLIESEATHQCLTVANHFTGVGGRVVQGACTTTDIFFQWKTIDQTSHGVEIFNFGDNKVAHPALCTNAIGAEVYMNVSNECLQDFWVGG